MTIHLVSLLQEKVKENRLSDIVDLHSKGMQLHEVEIMKMIKVAMWCWQNVSTTRPSMTTVVKVIEGLVNVETNIDYNFTDPTQQVPKKVDDLGASPPQSASLLSGGR